VTSMPGLRFFQTTPCPCKEHLRESRTPTGPSAHITHLSRVTCVPVSPPYPTHIRHSGAHTRRAAEGRMTRSAAYRLIVRASSPATHIPGRMRTHIRPSHLPLCPAASSHYSRSHRPPGRPSTRRRARSGVTARARSRRALSLRGAPMQTSRCTRDTPASAASALADARRSRPPLVSARQRGTRLLMRAARRGPARRRG